MPPLEGATQGQPGPVPQPPNIPALVLPAPTPDAAGKIEQSETLRHENGGAVSGTTGTAPGVGAPLTTLPIRAQQSGRQDAAFPGGLHILSPTSGGPGPLSETNSLEGGSASRVILVAVVKPVNTENNTIGSELAEQSGEILDAKAGIKGPSLRLPGLK
uniref:Pancreatic trypsin inhibitor n=1 Tax=Rhipicephalus appendiculatus TaxID=34631 RepID=A0A131YUI2_RHIAP